ncbi:MAG: helix-turn-helix domain-containing protein [Acidobacteria bacterium]|nr:helix-turn-helix domain-containing protein [Acidobacteriota bacterium]
MPQGQKEVKTQTHQMDEKTHPAAMTPDQAHELLGGRTVISRASFYMGIHRGQIPAVRIGRRLLIPRARFMAWLEAAFEGAGFQPGDTSKQIGHRLPARG